MPKCDFIKVALLSAWVFSCKFAAFFAAFYFSLFLRTPLEACFCKLVEPPFSNPYNQFNSTQILEDYMGARICEEDPVKKSYKTSA